MSLVLRPGAQLTAFADVAQCVVLLFANAGLLLNAASPRLAAQLILDAVGNGLRDVVRRSIWCQ